MSETYLRVCVLDEGHDGDHLPYHAAPKDEHGNIAAERTRHLPRCVHVEPIGADEETTRYRVVFEIIDPRMPRAGWHDVARETHDLADAHSQLDGLARLQADGDDVRNARLERAVVRWERVDYNATYEASVPRQRRPIRDNPQA